MVYKVKGEINVIWVLMYLLRYYFIRYFNIYF